MLMNRDLFTLKNEIEAVKADVQRLHAWLNIAINRLEKRMESFEIIKASNQASQMSALTKRPILHRAKQ